MQSGFVFDNPNAKKACGCRNVVFRRNGAAAQTISDFFGLPHKLNLDSKDLEYVLRVRQSRASGPLCARQRRPAPSIGIDDDGHASTNGYRTRRGTRPKSGIPAQRA